MGISPEHRFVRPARVLIADDNRDLRETINNILSDEGYAVAEARNGTEALKLLADSPIDVLLLDLGLPHLDGLELLRQLASPLPAVIICSAFSYLEEEDVLRQFGSRVFRSLRKPVHPRSLVAAVAEAVESLGGSQASAGGT